MNSKKDGNGDRSNSLDISSVNFNSESYLSDLFRKKNLDELVQVEEDMIYNVSYSEF